MGYGYAYDGPPARCHGSERPGMAAFADGFMAEFKCGTYGIYNCRATRTKKKGTLSFHADGRAWDAKCTGALNKLIAETAVRFADELGVQEVISQRRRWDSRTRKWEHYDGEDDHTGHVHISLCRAAATGLTVAKVRAVIRRTPSVYQENDMEIIEVTDGPDKGTLWLRQGDRYEHIDSPAAYYELCRIFPGRGFDKTVKVNNAAIWALLKGTAG